MLRPYDAVMLRPYNAVICPQQFPTLRPYVSPASSPTSFIV